MENTLRRKVPKSCRATLGVSNLQKDLFSQPMGSVTGNKLERATLDLPFATTWEKTGEDLE